MAAADAPHSGSPSQTEQLTAPPGWTKKLVPAKGTNITLRKHDVVFVAPDGQEIPSQWHLRRYLKAHPGGPAFSEFIWSSGEESIRRSARAIKEISYSEKRTPNSKGKRNAAEMDTEGAEEDKVKTPARKRAKKAGKHGDSSVVKGEAALPDKDEVMHEVPEGAGAGSEPDAQDEADTGNVQDGKMEEQVLGENSVHATDGVMQEEPKVEKETEQVEAVTEQVVAVTEQVVEVAENVVVTEQVVEVTEQVVEVKEQVEEVVTTDNKLQEEVEHKEASKVTPIVTPSAELNGEEPVVESEKLLEPADASVLESKEPLDQNLEVREDAFKIMTETPLIEESQELEKSLEPLMQKEEQERLPSGHNSPHKVEHFKEKSPNELSSSPVSVTVANQ